MSIKSILFVSVFLFIFLSGRAQPASEEIKGRYVEAIVFYYPWQVDTRIATTAKDVRKQQAKKTILDSAEIDVLLKRWIMPSKLRPVVKLLPLKDVRLVIDLFDREHKRTTYVANRFDLSIEDGAMMRQIDERFRDYFSSMFNK